MNKQEFIDWIDKLVSGRNNAFLDTFFGNFTKCHKEIKEIIGGDRLVVEVAMKKGEKPLRCVNQESPADTIVKLLPNYLKTYALNKSDLLEPKLLIKGREYKTCKHIQNYAGKVLQYEEYMDFLRDLLNQLGLEHARNNVNEGQYNVTLSINPQDILNVGNHGVDTSSCFNIKGTNGRMIFNFACIKNSFIILINDKQGIVGRALGFIDTQAMQFHVFNLYIGNSIRGEQLQSESQKTNVGNCTKIFEELASHLLGTKEIQLSRNLISSSDEHAFYLNQFPKFTFHQEGCATAKKYDIISHITNFH